jgi:hypothetical protein
MAPAVVAHPEARTTKGDFVTTEESSASPAQPSTEKHDRPNACIDGVVYIGHLAEDPSGATGEEVEVFEAVPCRRCADEDAAPNMEVHHRVPQCLLRLHDRATTGELDAAGIEAWLEFEHEAMRYGVDVEISREDLATLVAASTVLLTHEDHRNGHQSDFQRWGRRGGLETARRYGSTWMALLALRRWGRISAEDLDAAWVLR